MEFKNRLSNKLWCLFLILCITKVCHGQLMCYVCENCPEVSSETPKFECNEEYFNTAGTTDSSVQTTTEGLTEEDDNSSTTTTTTEMTPYTDQWSSTTAETTEETTVETTAETTAETTTDTTTNSTTESTTQSTTESTTDSTTNSTTESTTESTTDSTTNSTTESTTDSTTNSTTESTTESTTGSTTESTTETATDSTTTTNDTSTTTTVNTTTEDDTTTEINITTDSTTTTPAQPPTPPTIGPPPTSTVIPTPPNPGPIQSIDDVEKLNSLPAAHTEKVDSDEVDAVAVEYTSSTKAYQPSAAFRIRQLRAVGGVTYHCFKVQAFNENSTMITNRGCSRVATMESVCGQWQEKNPMEKLNKCYPCSNTKCNGSSALSVSIAAMFVALVAVFMHRK